MQLITMAIDRGLDRRIDELDNENKEKAADKHNPFQCRLTQPYGDGYFQPHGNDCLWKHGEHNSDDHSKDRYDYPQFKKMISRNKVRTLLFTTLAAISPIEALG